MKVMILGLNPSFSTLQYYYAWNFSVKWSIGLNECAMNVNALFC